MIENSNEIDAFRSVVEFVEGFNDLVDEVAALDFPSFLLGDLTNARPAVFSGTEEVFDAVDVSSLISTFLFGSFFAFLIS